MCGRSTDDVSSCSVILSVPATVVYPLLAVPDKFPEPQVNNHIDLTSISGPRRCLAILFSYPSSCPTSGSRELPCEICDRPHDPSRAHRPNSRCHRLTCSASSSGVSAPTSISRSAPNTGSSLPANKLACTSLGRRMCRAGSASANWCCASRSARTALALSTPRIARFEVSAGLFVHAARAKLHLIPRRIPT